MAPAVAAGLLQGAEAFTQMGDEAYGQGSDIRAIDPEGAVDWCTTARSGREVPVYR